MRPTTFVKTFIRSATSIEYYRSVLVAPAWFTVRFFLLSFGIYGVIVGYTLAQEFKTTLFRELDPTLATIKENFPEDGYIFWGEEGLEVRPDPFIVLLPETLSEAPSKRLAIVLTGEEAQPSSKLTADDSEVLAVVAKKTLYLDNQEGGWEKAELTEALGKEQLLINETTLPSILDRAKEAVLAFYPVLEKMIWGGSVLFLLVSGIFNGFFNGSILFLLSKLTAHKLSFKKAVQLSLHLLVPLQGVDLLARKLYPEANVPILLIGFWILIAYFFASQGATLKKKER